MSAAWRRWHRQCWQWRRTFALAPGRGRSRASCAPAALAALAALAELV